MNRRIGLVALALVAGAMACRAGQARIAQPKRVVPVLSTRQQMLAEIPESVLANTLVCFDTLGLDASTTKTGRCLPCIPPNITSMTDGGLRHARRLWNHIARAPHDTLFFGGSCAALAFEFAKTARPDDIGLDIELAEVRLASRNDSIRAIALTRLDTVLDSLLSRQRAPEASAFLEQFGRVVWDRAQRMLERPRDLPVHQWEEDAHQLTRGAPTLRALPAPPRASSSLGPSEAEWAARIFDRAAELAPGASSRSQLHRLALAPWVVLERWQSLDSAATRMLARSPGDSAVLPARAVAAFRRMMRPVQEQDAVWAKFDTAVRAMPRADSLRYDSFDGVLTNGDDEWRYGFLPSDRVRIDRRGWVVVDPLWSTRVNEVHLAKRARVAEADYRYADITKPGEAGSETRPGVILVRRGPLDPKWGLDAYMYRRLLRRNWTGLEMAAQIDNAPDLWRSFYTGIYAPARTVAWALSNSKLVCPEAGVDETVYSCARARRADWSGVPFWGTTDTIDVNIARFRTATDSIDMYVGARVPLRRFKHRDAAGASKDDRIGIGAWFTTPLGALLYHGQEQRPLPTPGLVAWTAQWTPRVNFGEVMHRVEALEPTRGVGARGALVHTSDEQVTFALRGFGVSDLLVATSARERRPIKRWTDLDLQPNGGVVAPGASFVIAWETYDLKPAADGMVHWRVTLHRETGVRERRDNIREVLTNAKSAGDRILASTPDVPAVAYTRAAPAAGAIAEHIRFNLGAVRPGRHVVELRVEDLVAKRTASRSVSVRVLSPEAQRRVAP